MHITLDKSKFNTEEITDRGPSMARHTIFGYQFCLNIDLELQWKKNNSSSRHKLLSKRLLILLSMKDITSTTEKISTDG